MTSDYSAVISSEARNLSQAENVRPTQTEPLLAISCALDFRPGAGDCGSRTMLPGGISMRSPRARVFLATVLFTIALAHATWAQRARMSYAGTAGFNMPFMVAHEAGLYKKYG